jgi:ABC-type branched-subunit amino acid transport system substrate-binding protein
MERERARQQITFQSSNQTLAALQILANAHLPLVSPTATSDMLTGKSPYFFRVVPSDKQQASVAATYVKQVLQDKRVAVFEDPTNFYSHSLAEAFRKSFADETHSIISNSTYTVNGDPTELIKAVEHALTQKPDLLYFAGYVRDASIVVQHLPPCTRSSSCLKMMGGDGLDVQGDNSLETYKSYGRILFTSFAFADKRKDQGLSSDDPFFKDYARAFDPHDQYRPRTYGYNLADASAMLSYDATGVLLHASTQLLESGKLHFSRDDLRLALTQITGEQAFQGVSGKISFADNGNVTGKAVLVLIGRSDGRIDLGSVNPVP